MTGEIFTMSRFPHRSLITAALITAVALTGCSNPRDDVRLTLCKDMVTGELGAEPTWQGSEVQIRGYEDAVVRVRFATGAGEGRAECAYPHAKGEDTAVTLANPIEAYATSPSRMTLNGHNLTGSELARAVQRAMGKQGHEFLDRAKETLRGQ